MIPMARKLERATFGSLFFCLWPKVVRLERTGRVFGLHNCSVTQPGRRLRFTFPAVTWEGDRTIVRIIPSATSRSSATEQVYGHKYISYDILFVDTEELNAYISIKLISQRRREWK